MRFARCKSAFAVAATRDGVILARAREPWLTQQGHLGLPETAVEARRVLSFIFLVLGGRTEQLASRRPTALLGDYEHPPTGTLIEVDTWQHFTTFRLISLNLYPPNIEVGFDVDEYRALCRACAPRSDHLGRSPVVGFGDAGLQRQRAYYDALRDLSAAVMGRPPVIRAIAVEGDGEAAYKRVRDQMTEL